MNKNELKELAKKIDLNLENFFQKSLDEYFILDPDGPFSELTYFEYIEENFLYIIEKYYFEYLKIVKLDELFWIEVILSCYSDMYNKGYYISDNPIEPNTSIQSFEHIVEVLSLDSILERYEDYDDSYIFQNFEGNENFQQALDRVQERNWKVKKNSEEELNFALNDEVCGQSCDCNIVKKFLHIDKPKISLHNINHDLSCKTEGVYQAIIYENLLPQKSLIWSNDFVELVNNVIKGLYIIDGEAVSINKIDFVNGDGANDKEIIYALAVSNQSVYIFFNNWRLNKNSESLKSFLILLYLNFHYISGNKLNIDSIESNSIVDLVNGIIELINEKYHLSNIENLNYSMSLDCLPEYNVFNYAIRYKYDLSSYIQSISVVNNYVTEPNYKEHLMGAWGSYIINSCNIQRDDLFCFLESYMKKYDDYKHVNEIYCHLFELGLYLEGLYLLRDIEKNYEEFKCFGISRLCNRLQDYLYRNNRDFKTIEDELSKLNEQSLENNKFKYLNSKHNEFLMMINNDMVTDYRLDDLVNLKNLRFNQLFNWGLDKGTCNIMESVLEKILFMVENKVRTLNGYEIEYNKVELNFIKYRLNCENAMKKFLGEKFDSQNFNKNFDKIITTLTTGEYLYNCYVIDNKHMDMDYSCIALEYYMALEYTVNLFFYHPYKVKVLDRRIKDYKGNYEDKFELNKFMDGYCGISFTNIFINKTKEFKSNIELGTIAYLYMEMLTQNNTIKYKYKYIAEYLSDLELNIEKVSVLFKYMDSIKKLRNEAAHGGNIISKNKAIKAQDVSYIHDPFPDKECLIGVADSCHRLLIELFELFNN